MILDVKPWVCFVINCTAVMAMRRLLCLCYWKPADNKTKVLVNGLLPGAAVTGCLNPTENLWCTLWARRGRWKTSVCKMREKIRFLTTHTKQRVCHCVFSIMQIKTVMVVERTSTTSLRLNLQFIHSHLTFIKQVLSFLTEQSHKQNKR